MFLDDAIGYRQSKPCTLAGLLGGEEGFEDVGQVGLINALSRIGYVDLHHACTGKPARKRLIFCKLFAIFTIVKAIGPGGDLEHFFLTRLAIIFIFVKNAQDLLKNVQAFVKSSRIIH